MFMFAKFEALRFLRQKGEILQELSDNGEIFPLLNQHLQEINLAGFLDRETVEQLLAQATSESFNIKGHVIIDEMTPKEFSRYANRKNYEPPAVIFRGNIRELDGKRSVDDDDDSIERNCQNYLLLSEDDDEIQSDPETVLNTIQTIKVQDEWAQIRQEMARVELPNDLENRNLEMIIQDNFNEIERYNARWGSDGHPAGYQFQG